MYGSLNSLNSVNSVTQFQQWQQCQQLIVRYSDGIFLGRLIFFSVVSLFLHFPTFFSREAEQDLSDCMEQLADVTLQNQALESSKRKLESELQTLHVGFVMMGFLT